MTTTLTENSPMQKNTDILPKSIGQGCCLDHSMLAMNVLFFGWQKTGGLSLGRQEDDDHKLEMQHKIHSCFNIQSCNAYMKIEKRSTSHCHWPTSKNERWPPKSICNADVRLCCQSQQILTLPNQMVKDPAKVKCGQGSCQGQVAEVHNSLRMQTLPLL